MLIRPHRRTDGDRIAEILAAGWKQAYAHFMPASFFAPRIDPARRRAEIAIWLDEDFKPDEETLLVAEADGAILGFINMILGDKADTGAAGYVNLLYVDPPQQRRGIGRALMREGARWQIGKASGPLALSAYADNPHRFAYDAMGGMPAKRVRPVIDGVEIEAVIYLWPDPAVLISG